MTTKTIDGVQALVAFIGITCGVIPLLQVLVGFGNGVPWTWLVDDPAGLTAYLGPIGVVVVSVVALGALERRKR